MAATPTMTVQQAHDLLRKIVNAPDGDELKQIIAANVMWCDGMFFAELERMVDTFTARGDASSAQKLKAVGDYMARLRFMI
ncbi:MAG: hypothetical protein ACE5G8_12285 [Anaerolineae bacterium]